MYSRDVESECIVVMLNQSDSCDVESEYIVVMLNQNV